jgi:hypothetical protein
MSIDDPMAANTYLLCLPINPYPRPTQSTFSIAERQHAFCAFLSFCIPDQKKGAPPNQKWRVPFCLTVLCRQPRWSGKVVVC